MSIEINVETWIFYIHIKNLGSLGLVFYAVSLVCA
jgi:hypothetical protein